MVISVNCRNLPVEEKFYQVWYKCSFTSHRTVSPATEQRYKLRTVPPATGTAVPSYRTVYFSCKNSCTSYRTVYVNYKNSCVSSRIVPADSHKLYM